MDDSLTKRAAVVDTLPTVFGYLGIATAFGVIARASGFSTITVILMSVIIYAGSAQFTTVSMLAAGSPIASIVFATFMVNSRMILMSTTVAPYFKKDNLGKGMLIGTLLTDESFALAMNKLNYTNGKMNFSWFNTENIISYSTWVIATMIGALLGNFIEDPKKLGLDFANVAMFIGLLYLQVNSDKALNKTLQVIVVLLTLVLTYISTIILPASLVIIAVTLIGCTLGMVIKHVFF
ncbi:branched-chain amino acid ABC transporter permease [Lactobacillus sp. ESL0263]|uniref:AzlC family ABC transporter permease n=1 Tax=Lactobacillus sp. ESL0263 TaxID=2069350 RepID=UPI000EFB0A52|nr:AzlC family ABC transporter permease [Lactobacillus sp. ESL0263]RMC50353.1 branched-chain amino acid ABC transporter permease [Lactobacillus sp. ESL0263]